VTFAPSDIEAFEIVKRSPGKTSSGLGRLSMDGSDVPTFRLVLVTRAGDAYPIEEFSTETQAKLRKKMIKRALRAED
jgi:hypothetical protein